MSPDMLKNVVLCCTTVVLYCAPPVSPDPPPTPHPTRSNWESFNGLLVSISSCKNLPPDCLAHILNYERCVAVYERCAVLCQRCIFLRTVLCERCIVLYERCVVLYERGIVPRECCTSVTQALYERCSAYYVIVYYKSGVCSSQHKSGRPPSREPILASRLGGAIVSGGGHDLTPGFYLDSCSL